MTRLVELLAAKHEISQHDAEQFLTKMVEVMNDGLHHKKVIKVKGLGTFKVTTVNARESVNVNTGERITIDGREKINFTPEPSMRDLVNRPFAQFETVIVNDGVDFDAIDKKYAQPAEETAEETSEKPEKLVADEIETAAEKAEPAVEKVAPVIAAVSTVMEAVKPETAEAAPVVENIQSAIEKEEPIVEVVEEVVEETEAAVEKAETPVEKAETEVEETEAIVEEKTEVSVEETTPEAEEVQPDIEETPNSAEETEPRISALAGEIGEPAEDAEPEPSEEPTEELPDEGETSSEPIEIEDNNYKTQGDMKGKNEEIDSQVDEYGYPIENDVKLNELSTRLDTTNKWLKGLIATVLCILLLALGGFYYLAKQLKERDSRIESLVTQIQEDQSNANIHKTGVAPMPRPQGKEDAKSAADREMKEQMAEHDRRVNELREKQRLEDQKREEAIKKAEADRKIEEARQAQIRQKEALAAKKAEEARKAEIAKKAEAARKAQAAQQAAKKSTATTTTASAQAAYNKDPRVRLGAYVITGVSETVTVREGQTLASISKAYLGPGMECYVEAVNGGIKTVKAGQKLKIPALKVKKAASKK
ncbi:MAG: HU family DNA-binding protein [Prevotella sp.]|nr:HU family DNA-binding protein [Prevotella sp.]